MAKDTLRRKILVSLGTGFGMLLSPRAANAFNGESHKSEAETPKVAGRLSTPRHAKRNLGYKLQSVPDDGTVFDAAKSSKARHLAEYILTSNDPRISYKDESLPGIVHSVRAAMMLDGMRYTVKVASYVDRRILRPDYIDIQAIPERLAHDVLVWSRNAANFADSGLDGRCNSGYLPANHILNPTNREIRLIEVFGGKILKPKIAPEDCLILDGAYQSTLDKLLTAYVTQKV